MFQLKVTRLCRIGGRKKFDLIIYVVVGFMASEPFHQQKQNFDTFHQPNVTMLIVL